MTEDKGTRKMIYFKSEKRYKLLKEILKELQTAIATCQLSRRTRARLPKFPVV